MMPKSSEIEGLIEKGAELSDDGLYRYLLWRRWDKTRPHAVFIMLNPSTADANIDDPTIRRCMGFARTWGLGGIRVVNLYPFRATKPEDLWKAAAPRGQGNLSHIKRAIDPHGINIAAWGAHGKEAKVREVRDLFYDLGVPLYALKINGDSLASPPALHQRRHGASRLRALAQPRSSAATRSSTAPSQQKAAP